MSHAHTDLTYVEGLGRATSCAVSVHHAPKPLRYVWHHVLPQTCGGLTVGSNLVNLCDSCHYSTHRLMYLLSESAKLPPRPNATQLALATSGWRQAMARGTDHLIPNEGGGSD